MSLRCIFCFGLLLITAIGWTQEIRDYDLQMQAKHSENKGYDPSYRVNYFENIIIRSTFSSNQYNLQYINNETGNTVDLRPAAENLIGLSVDYKWVALGVSYAPQFLISSEDKAALNSSETIKLNLNFFYSDRWRQEFSYIYNRGFRVQANIELTGAELDAVRNTALEVFQGSTYFILNKNFSFRAHYAQTERQLKSAGSFIPRINYVYSITKPFSTPIAQNPEATSKISSFDLIGSIGYLYTFVHNQKWLATVGLHPGIGYNNARYNYNNNTSRRFEGSSLTFKSEITLGYNSYRWFYGVNGVWQNFNNSNNQNNEFNRDAAFFLVYLGYRFNDNKPMRKFFGWFEEHLGF